MKREYCGSVCLEISDQLAIVTLTNPSKRNALSVKVLRSLVHACDDIRNSAAQAVVLRGQGPSFCTGLDIRSAVANPINFRRLLKITDGRSENLAQRAIICWKTLPMPVFAAVQGHCLGGGLQLALGADLRIATAECKFSLLEAKWGLIPDMGVTALLPRELPIDKAKELAMTGRIFNSEEALALGLISSISENPFQSCIELASDYESLQQLGSLKKPSLFDSHWLTGAPEVVH